MKLNWHRRKAIREVIKSIVIYIFLIVITVSVLFNYLGFTGKIDLSSFLNREVEIKEVETIREVEVKKEINWYRFWATGYSANDVEQGTNETMASGKRVYKGAIAADPYVLPLGTVVEIEGLSEGLDGIYKVEDTGGKIKGLDIDIYCETKLEALQISCYVWLRILTDEEVGKLIEVDAI